MHKAKIAVSVIAWVGVVLFAFHRSEHQDVLGRYSWGYASFLIFFVFGAGAASLAEPLWMNRVFQARVAIILSVSTATRRRPPAAVRSVPEAA